MTNLIANLTVQALGFEDKDALFLLADAWIDEGNEEKAEQILKAKFPLSDLKEAVEIIYKKEIMTIKILKKHIMPLYLHLKQNPPDKVLYLYLTANVLTRSSEQGEVLRLATDRMYFEYLLGKRGRIHASRQDYLYRHNLCKKLGEFKEARQWKHLIKCTL